MAWIFHTFYFIMLFSSVDSECVNQVYQDISFQGGDIAMVFAPDMEYCQLVCTYSPKCIFFTFLSGNWTEISKRFACFLKDTNAPMLPTISMEGAVSGHSLKQCSRITACSKDIHDGLDMQGTNYKVTTEGSYQHCQKRCTNEKHCQFFTYSSNSFHSSENRNKCFLKFSTTGIPTLIKQLGNVISGFSLKPCGVAETDCQMDIFQHQVFSGTPISKVFAPDTTVCRIICTYTPNCLFFTFYNSNWGVKNRRYICDMMTSRSGMPDSVLERENTTSGFSLLNCRKSLPACSSHIYSNLSFLGSDLSVQYVSGPKACQQLCTDTIRCQFFTYNLRKTSCNFESKCKCFLRMTNNGSPDKIMPENGMVSGYSLRLCQVRVDPVCTQKPKADTRIVGGTNSSHGEWPWQVSLHVQPSNQGHTCGGSIISDQWIVTAAHCTENFQHPQFWRVYSGILKLSEITKDTPFFDVQKIIVHPKFEYAEKGYDIALMKLDRPMNFTDLQQPLCLPLNNERNVEYTDCWVTGWGYTKENGKTHDVLQKVDIPLISNAECQSLYREFRISDSMLCAGYIEGGKDACKGDSGGPFQCKHQDTWYLVGITSWGEGCARKGKPAVFANMIEHSNWLLDKMLEN